MTLVEGELLLDAARVGMREIAAELGGLSPGKLHAADLAADALHRALGRPCGGRRGRARSRRTPRDERRRRLGRRRAARLARRRDAVAVTLELWADPENDAAASCCSADAVRARALGRAPDGHADLTLDLRAEFRAGVVDPFLAGYAAGETPNPCVGCNGHVRLDAMLDLADAAGRAPTSPPATTRGSPTDGLLRVVGRSGQGPDLHALRAGAGVARADALPARRADQA